MQLFGYLTKADKSKFCCSSLASAEKSCEDPLDVLHKSRLKIS